MQDLHLPVRMSSVHVTGYPKYPMLQPQDWVACIDKYGFWDKLFGPGVTSLQEGSCMLTDFWKKYSLLHPDFELFQAAQEHQIDLSKVCPLYIHGDEGQHYKKGAVMVVQNESLVGHGTTKGTDEQLDVFNNEVDYLVNSKGVTLSTRFLTAVMPKATLQHAALYCFDP